MLKINGIPIKIPHEISVNISDIDGESRRNAKGNIVRDRIAVKRNITLTFSPLTNAQIQMILQAISSEFFDVEYTDPMLGRVVKTFYVGDRTAPVYYEDNDNCYWKSLSFELVER